MSEQDILSGQLDEICDTYAHSGVSTGNIGVNFLRRTRLLKLTPPSHQDWTSVPNKIISVTPILKDRQVYVIPEVRD